MSWLRYNNESAIRSQPLSSKLVDALSFLPEMGIEMEVHSGGQAPKGSGGPRTGSTRHDHGNAADADFYYQGRKLDWNNPDDVPLFQEMVKRGKQRGVTGWGAGDDYMGAGRMHVGFGNPGVWGADGKGANAPDWLRSAYHGEPGHVHKPGDESQAIADQAMSAIGKQPARQTTSSISTGDGALSLLGGIANDTLEAPMEPEKAGGLLGKIFPNMTANRRDEIKMGLAGMSLNPNVGLIRGLHTRMSDRREDAKTAKEQAQAQKRENRTAQVMKASGAPDYLVQAAENGYAKEAFKEYLRLKGEKPSGPNYAYHDGAWWNADNPQAGPVAGSPGGGAKPSEADQEIARLESIGIPRDVAIRIKEGVYKTVTDPYTRETRVVDLSSGNPVFQTGSEATPSAIPTEPSAQPMPGGQGPDASDAFGFEGMVKGGINSAADFIGVDAPYDGVQQTQSDFAVLRENLVNDISQGYGQRVPAFLLKNIEDLTPKTGGFQGASDAQSKLGALERSFTQELGTVRQQLGRQISPQQRQVLTNREAALNAALGKVTGALTRFGSSDGGNKTSSGVTWRIEQ
ncbi:hypothetical protein [Sulfitobacter sp. 1A12157]|uniref:hypothetical protein n=1 Tax=Sulfitobacter sp. 1A12157 TaxID=3368594 RepID=UPI0037455177